MNVKALIVEQLNLDRTLLTFKMEPNYPKRLIVAFADEYDDIRHGPFHFLDEQDSRIFERGFAKAQTRKVSIQRFYQADGLYVFNTSWAGIPTARNELTYYALSLPEFAIPVSIEAVDPYTNRQYNKNVSRDDQKNRFVIYLECRSSRGLFDFILTVKFQINRTGFLSASYQDEFCNSYGHQIDSYRYLLDTKETTLVQQFFTERIHMGDTYNANQVGAMGPNAQASNMTFQQIWLQEQDNIDLVTLAKELSLLRQQLRQKASLPEHDVAIAQIAQAEQAAIVGNGPKVMQHLKETGKWALECARDIGVDVAAEVIKKSMGL